MSVSLDLRWPAVDGETVCGVASQPKGLAPTEHVMRLTEVFASNFRCFPEAVPLRWSPRAGVSLLAGENDSGKSAVIDAIRLVLGTRSDDYSLQPEDFHLPAGAARTNKLVLRCSFDSLTDDERAAFLEWCSIDAAGTFRLHVCLRAELVEQKSGVKRAFYEHRSGEAGDGPAVQGRLREYLRVPYLRPLRNAEAELSAGRRSRLAQILAALPEMAGQKNKDEKATLAGIAAEADAQIKKNAAIDKVQTAVNQKYLAGLSVGDTPMTAALSLGNSIGLGQILERLELSLESPAAYVERLRRGLGLNNILFMAAELLLLGSQTDQIPLLLIEEPEAHLHPPLQARFMQVMQERAADKSAPLQIITTTHSPILAAQANLEDLTVVARAKTYGLQKGATKLDADDYRFLRRFLDATKANLFFAKGVVIVEGDGENLLLPAIARKIDRPLDKSGVSIVKVGHVGLFRYSRILQRSSGDALPIPVARLADRDIPPDSAAHLLSKDRKTLGKFSDDEVAKRVASLQKGDEQNVATFVSEHWTFEYELAYHGMGRELYQAIKLAESPDQNPEDAKASAKAEFDSWPEKSDPEKLAVRVYGYLKTNDISKAATAQYLADVIEQDVKDTPQQFLMRLPPYIVEAIKHVTGTGASAHTPTASGLAPTAKPTTVTP